MRPGQQWEEVENQALAALDKDDLDQALQILMNAYGNPLYRFCVRIVRQEATAEDVVQTTFVQAYQGLAGFERRSTLRSWLFGIARHRGLDALKMDRRRESRVRPVSELPNVAAELTDANEQLEQSDLRRAMSQCLAQLSEKIRETLLLRFRDGLSYPEIAEMTAERAPALQARVTRALPLLKNCLQKKGLLHVEL